MSPEVRIVRSPAECRSFRLATVASVGDGDLATLVAVQRPRHAKAGSEDGDTNHCDSTRAATPPVLMTRYPHSVSTTDPS